MTGPRVLFFVPGLNVGGAERHATDLRVRLEARGFETQLLVFGRRRSEVILAHPGARDAVLLDLRGMSDPRGWWRLRAQLRRTRPDVVVAVNQTPLIAAVAVRLLGGLPARIACVFHSTVLLRKEERRVALFRWASRFAEALVFVSANQKRHWTGRGLRCARMPVILNGVDLDRFDRAGQDRAAARASLGLGEHAVVAGLVATFRPEKDHATFLRALALLRDRGCAMKGLLVGDGPTRDACERLADRLGLRDLVVFAGERADVRPAMAACDVGVLCSVAVETFSLSAIEFLAMGVPMVMSRVGGASEIVEEGVNGLMFEPGDVEGLARALETAAADRARLAAAARSSVGHLSVEAMVERYVDLLRSLVRDKR